jgi:hypothetical protein
MLVLVAEDLCELARAAKCARVERNQPPRGHFRGSKIARPPLRFG